jgi:type VI secretion system secreted protein VgrG
MEDKENFEHIHLTTPYQTSELNLGHMVDGQRKERGRGAELRSDERVAVRGNGIYITAKSQPATSGRQLDMVEGVSQLESSLQLARALASTAEAAGANPVDTDSQQQVSVRGFRQRRVAARHGALHANG